MAVNDAHWSKKAWGTRHRFTTVSHPCMWHVFLRSCWAPQNPILTRGNMFGARKIILCKLSFCSDHFLLEEVGQPTCKPPSFLPLKLQGREIVWGEPCMETWWGPFVSVFVFLSHVPDVNSQAIVFLQAIFVKRQVPVYEPWFGPNTLLTNYHGSQKTQLQGVVMHCLVYLLFLTSVCITDCHAIHVLWEWVLSMHPVGITRYKQEKQVQLNIVLTHLICTRVASQVQGCTLAH